VAITLNIDDALLRMAQEIGGHTTETETVTAALREYVQRRQQAAILELVGTVDYADDYDYKALRRRS
jgi:Arc/MetJ family transcription regulator